MTAPEARDAVVEEFYLPHYRTLLSSTEVERRVIDSMAEEIVRRRQIVERTEAKLAAIEAKLAAVEVERDALKHVVETYGEVRLRPITKQKLVHVTFSVTYEALKYARDPELVFASAISDVMCKFREFTREQKQVDAAEQEVDDRTPLTNDL